MFRDLLQGSPIEADQIIGDLLARGAKAGIPTPLLAAAYANMSVYQDRLIRRHLRFRNGGTSPKRSRSTGADTMRELSRGSPPGRRTPDQPPFRKTIRPTSRANR
jgi:Ketopantoate reductase PanE/ApbA C terminal